MRHYVPGHARPVRLPRAKLDVAPILPLPHASGG